MSLYRIGLESPVDFIKRKAREGAMEGVDKKIPEIQAKVKETVTPIVKKGIIASLIAGIIGGIVVSKARR